MRAIAYQLASALLCFALASIGWADELADTKAALEKVGVRVSTVGIALAKEAELTKELAKSAALKRNVLQAQKELQFAEQQQDAVQQTIAQLKQQHTQFSTQLINVAQNDVERHNKLVSAIKITESNLEEMSQNRE